MSHNPILEELYAIRERLLADAGGDIQSSWPVFANAKPLPAACCGSGEAVSEPDPSLTSGCSGPAAPAAEPGR